MYHIVLKKMVQLEAAPAFNYLFLAQFLPVIFITPAGTYI